MLVFGIFKIVNRTLVRPKTFQKMHIKSVGRNSFITRWRCISHHLKKTSTNKRVLWRPDFGNMHIVGKVLTRRCHLTYESINNKLWKKCVFSSFFHFYIEFWRHLVSNHRNFDTNTKYLVWDKSYDVRCKGQNSFFPRKKILLPILVRSRGQSCFHMVSWERPRPLDVNWPHYLNLWATGSKFVELL